MVTQSPTTSALGYGLSCGYCAATLPFPSPDSLLPVMLTVTALQPALGIGRDPKSGALLPSATSGRQLLAEAIARRLSTARGTLPDTKVLTTVGNYGLDLLDYADADMTTSDCGRLAASIDAQCRQDERVINSVTTAAVVDSTLIIITRLTDGAGPFRLTTTIDLLTGALLGMTT